jgi:putative transposase
MFPKRTRLKTFAYTGCYRYFLTFCTHQRHDAFVCRKTVGDVHAQIVRAAQECGFAIHAYAFMRDHVHLLVEGITEVSDLRLFARLAKQYSGYAHAQRGMGRLWQPSYFEHILREEEDTTSVIAYIMNNPIRAGYARTFGEYEYAGSDTTSMTDIAEVLRSNPRPPWEP